QTCALPISSLRVVGNAEFHTRSAWTKAALFCDGAVESLTIAPLRVGGDRERWLLVEWGVLSSWFTFAGRRVQARRSAQSATSIPHAAAASRRRRGLFRRSRPAMTRSIAAGDIPRQVNPRGAARSAH